MRNKLFFVLIFFLSLKGFASASSNQILTDKNPLEIVSSSGKGSIYMKVSLSSVYSLNFNESKDANTVFILYNTSTKEYITNKIYGKSIEVKLKKDILYAIIYVSSPDSKIKFSLSDLDFSILNEKIPKSSISTIKNSSKEFKISNFDNLELGSKLKKYILKTYKNNIYVVYQTDKDSNIKISGFIENIGWFDINNSINKNIENIENFDFTINSKGELYVVFVTKSSKDFSSELIVKKFNGRKWIDISPDYIYDVGSLVNIAVDKDDVMYISYLAKQKNTEYKIILIKNEGKGKFWDNIANSYISNGDANVNGLDIKLIAEPFLGFFYNYKSDNEIKSEFIINKGKTWENTNTISTYMASSIRILYLPKENQIFMGYVSGNRPVITDNIFFENKWKNISPNISYVSDNSSIDIEKYNDSLILVLSDNSNLKLFSYLNGDWSYFNNLDVFKSNATMPQFEIYNNRLILSYFSSDTGELIFNVIE